MVFLDWMFLLMPNQQLLHTFNTNVPLIQ